MCACVSILGRLTISRIKNAEDFQLPLATMLSGTTPVLETEDKDLTRNMRCLSNRGATPMRGLRKSVQGAVTRVFIK